MNHAAIAAALRQIADALDEEPKPEATAIAQPKLPEGYNPHRPGDPCPINPENFCHVAFRVGASSEECSSNPIKAGQWNWSDDDDDLDIIGYKIVPSPEKPKPEWPWKPKRGERYYVADTTATVGYGDWEDDSTDENCFQSANCYKTDSEARARAELDKRLAMTARLRQLGGGDDGEYTVRWDVEDGYWTPWSTDLFAPGEARFVDEETASAAIETLRAAGLLPESWK